MLAKKLAQRRLMHRKVDPKEMPLRRAVYRGGQKKNKNMFPGWESADHLCGPGETDHGSPAPGCEDLPPQAGKLE